MLMNKGVEVIATHIYHTENMLSIQQWHDHLRAHCWTAGDVARTAVDI
jgi:hypothetical protein